MRQGASHEDFARRHDTGKGSDRAFGLVFAAFFFIVAAWPSFGGAGPRWWALGLALAFAGVALVRPRALAPLNRLWFEFGLLLGRIVHPIVMGVIFFAVITPMALVMRATGRDPLRLHRDPGAPTYWIARVPPGPAPESFKNPF